ncbi:hypothetical protein GCK72_001944 [Caenorhabditis remanei]|uniref:J domain-containing protein n=1 Tax=Caenorhabditis remanei TaxID=31234 RepID=A0A6A5HTN7_CAERE|nr:hypothetical protein GCK72_001944 [Caenorhabditis remanei]KAF1770126.1 hypothetical protein GCK72_001944 [Caenorhabditis remanei]
MLRVLRCSPCGAWVCQIRLFNKKLRPKTHYEVLGVESTATLAEIKTAFYSQSKKAHPDNSADEATTARFLELKNAYDVLRRPADRSLYDYQLKGGGGRYPNAGYRYQYPSTAPPQYDFGRDWSTYWSQNPDNSRSAREERDKSARQFMKSIIKWTAFGLILVAMYNGGYVLVFCKLFAYLWGTSCGWSAEGGANEQVAEIGRILKADVDEIWKMKTTRNPDEIREEYRWFRALQDTDHIRSLKEKRMELKEKERNKWRNQDEDG